MGIGVTGYMQATEEQKSWLKDCYTELRKYDKAYSKLHNWPESIKLTTVKPSGTLSLLAGVTPGVHPGYAEYFIRRIRIATGSQLLDVCRNHGYHVEPVKLFDGTDDKNTWVVEFPCKYPKHTVFAGDITAVQQLEAVKRLQTEWSDNSVSCTVYYRKEELPEIKEWLSKNYNDSCKTLSFLLHSDHGFAQAPYEEITKEKYEELAAKVKPITSIEISESEMELEECESGSCPIK
jgi:ribonucleoside-diphosphate reductase alpha chain/ribonucleoside-triphosphate reductase